MSYFICLFIINYRLPKKMIDRHQKVLSDSLNGKLLKYLSTCSCFYLTYLVTRCLQAFLFLSGAISPQLPLSILLDFFKKFAIIFLSVQLVLLNLLPHEFSIVSVFCTLLANHFRFYKIVNQTSILTDTFLLNYQ